MMDGAVLPESASSGVVDIRFVGHQMRSRRSLGAKNRFDVFRVDVRNVEGASDAAALDKVINFYFVVSAAVLYAKCDSRRVSSVELR